MSDFSHYCPAPELPDFRFEITALDEPEMGCTHFVRMIEFPGPDWPCETVIESFTTDNPYGAVEAARELQAYPDMEERFAMYYERGF